MSADEEMEDRSPGVFEELSYAGQTTLINLLLARISLGLSCDEGQNLPLLPIEIPALVEHESLEGSQGVAGF